MMIVYGWQDQYQIVGLNTYSSWFGEFEVIVTREVLQLTSTINQTLSLESTINQTLSLESTINQTLSLESTINLETAA